MYIPILYVSTPSGFALCFLYCVMSGSDENTKLKSAVVTKHLVNGKNIADVCRKHSLTLINLMQLKRRTSCFLVTFLVILVFCFVSGGCAIAPALLVGKSLINTA